MTTVTYVVFPAHAGMSPLPWSSAVWGTSFPRPRGDEPPNILAGLFSTGFSPPTRG